MTAENSQRNYARRFVSALEIVSEIEKHCTHFYIRANRCSSLYDDLFSLRGWKTEEINGIQLKNSNLVSSSISLTLFTQLLASP